MNAAVCVVVTVPTEAEEQRLCPRACCLCGGSLLEAKGSSEMCRRCCELTNISGNGGLDLAKRLEQAPSPAPASAAAPALAAAPAPRYPGRSLPLRELPPDASLEQLLRAIAEELRLDCNVFWSQDLSGRQLQARFDLQQDERYERLLCTLQDWGVGERPGTHVSAINCLETRDKPPQGMLAPLPPGQVAELQRTNQGPGQAKSPGQAGLGRQGWQSFVDSVRCRLNVNQVVRQVRRDATFTFDFVVLLISAALLSCVGLVENSFLFLSSSMLISPLMGPIIAAIFGSVIGDRELCWLGLKNELLGIGLSVAIGFVFGGIVCGVGFFFAISTGLTDEIVSRCDTHSLAINVCTALASGAAGAIAVLGGNTGSLVGVAISASLLPPAVNAGLLWALAIGTRFLAPDHELLQSLQKHRTYSDRLSVELVVCASVSMTLTLLNIVCVWLMGVVVLRIKEVAPAVKRNQHFWHHDLRTAREVALLDPALQTAIDQLDESQLGGSQTGASTAEDAGTGYLGNYHTVHGFKEFCLTVHRLNAVEAQPREAQPPSVMELFAPQLQPQPQPAAEKEQSVQDTSQSGLEDQPATTEGNGGGGQQQCNICQSLPNLLRPLNSELSLPSLGSVASKDRRTGHVLIPLPNLEPKDDASLDRPLNLLPFGNRHAEQKPEEEAQDNDECQV